MIANEDPHRGNARTRCILSPMNLVTQLFAWIAVVFHVAAFVMESVLFERPAVQRFLLGRTEAAPGVRLWAFNQGFYNLFLAAGPAAGLIAGYAGNDSVG